MRCVSALAILFALAAPASADLRDVVLSRDGETAWIQLVFDAAPSDGDVLTEPGGLAVVFSAPGIMPPAVETASGDVVRAIRFSDQDGRIRAEFDLAVAWTDARLRIEGNRIIVRLSGLAASGDELPASHLTTPQAGGVAPDAQSGTAAESETPDPVPGTDIPIATVEDGRPAELTPGGDACDEADARIIDDPWDLDAMIVQAECARSDGNAAEAAALLERVTAMDPERFSALLMLAEIEAESGDRDAARAFYEMAAQAARTDGEAAAAMARMRALSD
ncbi:MULTISPECIES: tetratricopeptide repeat protein [Hyphobacterium]|uniref:Tetratricopeptide repeat protein n=1 Tax=Hyphobacterium vulgare TaxID=1736751 RepID=A0ABV6ZYN5_9PROT